MLGRIPFSTRRRPRRPRSSALPMSSGSNPPPSEGVASASTSASASASAAGTAGTVGTTPRGIGIAALAPAPVTTSFFAPFQGSGSGTEAGTAASASASASTAMPDITHIGTVGVLEPADDDDDDDDDDNDDDDNDGDGGSDIDDLRGADEVLNQGWDTASGVSASLTSSILAHTFENGRRYHSYKRGTYPVPNDDIEQSREDMKHAQMLDLADGKLFLAPIDDHPQKILDIGTGTGTWAIEMGELFPGASILGVDLSPIQPTWVPPNVRFIVDDIEEDWLNGNDWDFVHFRNMAFCMRDVPKAVRQAYEHLKPGGWIEFQESSGNLKPRCDDGTMKEDDILLKYYHMCKLACKAYGCNIESSVMLGDIMQQAGFVGVTCVEKKVPIGTWAKDAKMRLIGLYAKESILSSVTWNALGKPFSKLGIDEVEGQVWVAGIRAAVTDNSVHRYYPCYFWYAQKPK